MYDVKPRIVLLLQLNSRDSLLFSFLWCDIYISILLLNYIYEFC